MSAANPVHQPTRRHILQALAALGAGSAVFHRAVVAQAVQAEQAGGVTPEMIQQAEWIAGLKLTEEQRKSTAAAVNQALRDFQALRGVPLDSGAMPALTFMPALGQPPGPDRPRGTVEPSRYPAIKRPGRFDMLVRMGPPSWDEKLRGLDQNRCVYNALQQDARAFRHA